MPSCVSCVNVVLLLRSRAQGCGLALPVIRDVLLPLRVHPFDLSFVRQRATTGRVAGLSTWAGPVLDWRWVSTWEPYWVGMPC